MATTVPIKFTGFRLGHSQPIVMVTATDYDLQAEKLRITEEKLTRYVENRKVGDCSLCGTTIWNNQAIMSEGNSDPAHVSCFVAENTKKKEAALRARIKELEGQLANGLDSNVQTPMRSKHTYYEVKQIIKPSAPGNDSSWKSWGIFSQWQTSEMTSAANQAASRTNTLEVRVVRVDTIKTVTDIVYPKPVELPPITDERVLLALGLLRIRASQDRRAGTANSAAQYDEAAAFLEETFRGKPGI